MSRGLLNTLFNYLDRPPREPDQSEITQTDTGLSVRLENVLLEEFRRATIMVYQIKEDITSTFNVYLIGAGVVATGVVALQTFISDSRDEYSIRLYEFLMIVVLVSSVILSCSFFARFLQLFQESMENTTVINNIKQIYLDQLPLSHVAGLKVQIEKVLKYPKESGFQKDIPSIIRYPVAILGSISFGGAVYVGSGIAVGSFQIDISLQIFLTVIAFGGMLIGYLVYYRTRLSKIDNRIKEITLPDTQPQINGSRQR